jgi:hypothetical protein
VFSAKIHLISASMAQISVPKDLTAPLGLSQPYHHTKTQHSRAMAAQIVPNKFVC